MFDEDMYDEELFQKKFRKAIKAIISAGNFRGQPVYSHKEAYEILAPIIHYSKNSIKQWKGGFAKPSLEGVIALEEALGISLRSDETENQCNKKEDKNDMNKINAKTDYNEFTKRSLFSVNRILKQYLHNGDIEDEDCYCDMISEVELERPAIPDPLFKEIENFIQTNIAPYIYGAENEPVEDEEGYQTDEAVKQLLANYFKVIMDIEAKWDAYASEKLYPIIRA